MKAPSSNIQTQMVRISALFLNKAALLTLAEKRCRAALATAVQDVVGGPVGA